MSRALWVSEFEFQRGALRVKQTGAVVPLNRAIVREFFDWFWFYGFVCLCRLWNGVRFRRGPRIAFAPAPPRPWYLLWAVARIAGARFVPVERADYVFYFEDSTTVAPGEIETPPHVERVNFACTDVSKTTVSEKFEAVFGYGLKVDPASWTGEAVEKSELNGAHDGRIVQCPIEPKPGYSYQQVIDNRIDGGLVEDIRCPTIEGTIPVVFLKRRGLEKRFANENDDVAYCTPEDVLSADECEKLRAFAEAMELQWGGLDVLRDRSTGRIYVVDVNKTDMGPPTALPLAAKASAALRLARAFRDQFKPHD